MRRMRRIYVYEDTYNKIMEWGREQIIVDNTFRTPNSKMNFPYFLSKIVDKIIPQRVVI